MKKPILILLLMCLPILACGGSSAAPTRAPSAPSFDEVVDNYRSMTEAQFDIYAESVEGSRITTAWEGTVDDVRANDDTPGGYVIMVEMSDEIGPEVLLGTGESTALKYSVGDPVHFTGLINDVDSSVGLTIIILEASVR